MNAVILIGLRACELWIAPIGLAGCSLLPGSGPSGDAIHSGAEFDAATEHTFGLIEIDSVVLDVLARRLSATLRSVFGDHRPPVAQQIGVGDTLQITIWEAADGGLFSSPAADRLGRGARSAHIPEQIVARDGAITVPYAGRVAVVGFSTQEVASMIVERLRGKAIEPQALVNVTRNVSNMVTVAGEVAAGARIPLTLRGDRIMDVIAAAGGYRSAAHETFVNLLRDERSARIPLQTLIDNPRENIYARPRDVGIIERAPRNITVIGAIGINGRIVPFDARGMTLEEAIGKAGGLIDQRADPGNVFVLRYEPQDLAQDFRSVSPTLLSRPIVPIVYHLNLRDPKALFDARRFSMQEKDILYVSNAPLVDVQKVLQLFGLLTSPVMQGAGGAASAGVKL